MQSGFRGKKLPKRCFITTGATAPFPELVKAALSPKCLEEFAAEGYSELVLQIGDAMDYFYKIKPDDTKGLELRAFAFNETDNNKEYRACQAKPGVIEQGLVISHAGKRSPYPRSLQQ